MDKAGKGLGRKDVGSLSTFLNSRPISFYHFVLITLVITYHFPLSVAEEDQSFVYETTRVTFDKNGEENEEAEDVITTLFDNDENVEKVVVIKPKSKSQPIVLSILSGSIRGERLTLEATQYDIFKGIPYAAPVDTPLTRFERPQQPHMWRGTMNATQYGPACVQANEKSHQQQETPSGNGATDAGPTGEVLKIRRSEDCLSINVFAPGPPANESFPVIVWIHGGGFQSGTAADYKQEAILRNFVSRRLVFVTFNYRLGPYGFASTGDDMLPGNYGLWDQIEALHWVKRNIERFGGDPNSVTLMGQGTGAASVSILGLSPRAADLFHRMILLSGAAISPGIVRDTAINATKALERHLHCQSRNSSEIALCLRQRHYSAILDPDRPRVSYDDNREFVPIVDGYGGVIPHSPHILLENHRKMPVLLGTTRDESMLHLVILGKEGINMSALNRDRARYLVRNLTASYQGFRNHDLITEGCFYEYVLSRNDPSGMTEEDLQNGILALYSHFWYHAPAARLAEYYSTNSPVYLYSFDHVSEHLFPGQITSSVGAFHGSDLVFLFDYEVSVTAKTVSSLDDYGLQSDKHVTALFAEYLTNFARYGHPTPPDTRPSVTWQEFDPQLLNYMSISERPAMKLGYHWRGHAFWNIYAQKLDGVDIGNARYIQELRKELGDYQLATWVLLGCAAFFFLILVGLACYCTRKDTEEEEEL